MIVHVEDGIYLFKQRHSRDQECYKDIPFIWYKDELWNVLVVGFDYKIETVQELYKMIEEFEETRNGEVLEHFLLQRKDEFKITTKLCYYFEQKEEKYEFIYHGFEIELYEEFKFYIYGGLGFSSLMGLMAIYKVEYSNNLLLRLKESTIPDYITNNILSFNSKVKEQVILFTISDIRKKLDFEGVVLSKEIIQIVSDFIKRGKLICLNLSSCGISNDEAKLIFHSMMSNSTITHLKLKNNAIGKETINLISSYLNSNSTIQYLNLKGNKLPSFFNDNGGKKLLNFLKESIQGLKDLKRLKLVFIGDGATGKTTLIHAMKLGYFNKFWGTKEHMQSTSTIGIETYNGHEIGLADGYDYQVWDFAGQLEYGTTHKHFLSNTSIIILIVISLGRDTLKQLNYWFDYITSFENQKDSCEIIVICTKSDLITEQKRKEEKLKIDTALKKMGYDIECIITSAFTLDKISTLKSKITQSAKRIIDKGKNLIPTSYYVYYDYYKNVPNLISQTLPEHKSNVLQYLHDLGDIVLSTDGNYVFTDPQIFSKIMSLFICPVGQENSLLHFIEKLKRPINSIVSHRFVVDRISRYFALYYPQLNTMTSINLIIDMMKELGFLIELDDLESGKYLIEKALLFPSLRPVGNFRWISLSNRELKSVKTIGRRFIKKDGKFIYPHNFIDIQVKIIKIFKLKMKTLPIIYSNGILLNMDHLQILLIVSESKLHMDLIIRCPNPPVLFKLLEDIFNNDCTMHYLIPSDIFKNKQLFPLSLSHLRCIDNSLLDDMIRKKANKIIKGKLGDTHISNSIWSFSSDLIFTHNNQNELQFVKITYPIDGQWKDLGHKIEWERVYESFKYFIGFDSINKFKLTKIIALKNETLERRFSTTYYSFSNRLKIPKIQKKFLSKADIDHQEAILDSLSNFVISVSGDEQTNLILCWHGGCADPFGVAKENFRIPKDDEEKSDGGYFGNGIYFTKYISYGDNYARYREKYKNLSPGAPIILSWVIMGRTYPVIEHPEGSNTLWRQPCREGYDSHYTTVKKSHINVNDYFPCNPREVTPDYDEIIIFNPDQILPRYLVYYERVEDTNIVRTILWVDSNHQRNKHLIKKVESPTMQVILFGSSIEIQKWLERNSTSSYNDKNCCIISNGFRPEDGGESAGARLCQWLKMKESEWSSIPFMLLSSDISKVHGLPNVPGVFVTNDEQVVVDFCYGIIPRK